jgi:hypothetical protein
MPIQMSDLKDVDLWKLNRSELFAIASSIVGLADPADPKEVLIQNLQQGTIDSAKELTIDPRKLEGRVNCKIPYSPKPPCVSCAPLLWVLCQENLETLIKKGGDPMSKKVEADAKLQITSQLYSALGVPKPGEPESSVKEGTPQSDISNLRQVHKILQKADLAVNIGELLRLNNNVKKSGTDESEIRRAFLHAILDKFELPDITAPESDIPLDTNDEVPETTKSETTKETPMPIKEEEPEVVTKKDSTDSKIAEVVKVGISSSGQIYPWENHTERVAKQLEAIADELKQLRELIAAIMSNKKAPF